MTKVMYQLLTYLIVVGVPVVFSADECRAREKYIREPWTGEPLKNLAFISDKDGLTCILNFHGHDNYLFYDQIVLSNKENKVIKTNNGNIKHLKFDYTNKNIGWINYTFSIENNSHFTVKIWDDIVLIYTVDFPVKAISTYGSNISLCSKPSWAVGENEAVVIPLYSRSRDEERTGMPNPIKSSIYITLSSTVLFNPVIKIDGMKKFLTMKDGNVLLLSNFSQPLQPNKYILELQTQQHTVNINYKLDNATHKMMEFQVKTVLSEIEISSQGRSFTVDLDISSALNLFNPPSPTTLSTTTTQIIPMTVTTATYTNISEAISTDALMHGLSAEQPKGQKIGLLVGIIITLIVLLTLVITIIFYMRHQKARSQKQNDLTDGNNRCITPEQDCLMENIDDIRFQKTDILNERNYPVKISMEENSSECLKETRCVISHVDYLQTKPQTMLDSSASSNRFLDLDKVRNDEVKISKMQNKFNSKEEEYLKTIHKLQTEIQDASTKYEREIRDLEVSLEEIDKECTMLKEENKIINKKDKSDDAKICQLKEEFNRKEKDFSNTIHNLQTKIQNASTVFEREKQKAKKENYYLKEENSGLAQDFNKEKELRKMFYYQILDTKGKIRVFCRIRPLGQKEKEDVTEVKDEYNLNINSARGTRSFTFDRIFHKHDNQNTVFKDTNDLILSSLDGNNVTIIAYGQTGSGKTYTMIGTEDSPGIAPKAFKSLFKLVNENYTSQNVQVSTYMIELYNDKLIDLFKQNGGKKIDDLEIKLDKEGTVRVEKTNLKIVNNEEELLKVFHEGLENRKTAATHMNAESSRSHLLFTICLTITSRQTRKVLRGKLTLVDLAGSERLPKDGGVSEKQRKETISINTSLSALSNVINALSSEASFVPYRPNKLTMLLQDSLGGNAKTLVFVNASPSASNVDETLNSLMYASRIKDITNTVNQNSDNKDKFTNNKQTQKKRKDNTK